MKPPHDLGQWLTASDAEFELMAGGWRELQAQLVTADELAELFRVNRRSISNLGNRLVPRQGGGRGIKARYHMDDVRAYLAQMNPDVPPADLLPTVGGFLRPDEFAALVGDGSISNVRKIRVTARAVRYREQDVAAYLASLDDGSELAKLIRSEWESPSEHGLINA